MPADTRLGVVCVDGKHLSATKDAVQRNMQQLTRKAKDVVNAVDHDTIPFIHVSLGWLVDATERIVQV